MSKVRLTITDRGRVCIHGEVVEDRPERELL